MNNALWCTSDVIISGQAATRYLHNILTKKPKASNLSLSNKGTQMQRLTQASEYIM